MLGPLPAPSCSQKPRFDSLGDDKDSPGDAFPAPSGEALGAGQHKEILGA